MNKLEEAIIYATIMHQGKVRKFTQNPFILHPLEVAQILSTMTEDMEIITAGILHDIVEDTDGTLEEIEKRFGESVAELVEAVSEQSYPGEEKSSTWKCRKEASMKVLVNTQNTGVKMLWLADSLANLRSIAALYSEIGEDLWEKLHQHDPEAQCWYYRTIAENVELSLNRTGAFKEFIKHINFIWPGTFDSEKTRYKKYKEVSIDNCKLLGWGAKGSVYRYDDELVIKVFNENNTYHDVEREIALSRAAFILGIPTAISFGIVSVGERYGAMYELVDSETVSKCISRDPGRVAFYAKNMASLAHTIHGVEVTEEYEVPAVTERLQEYIDGGIALEDKELTKKVQKLLDALPVPYTLVHGDFHTGNVFLQKGELLLIDMDRVSRGHPIAEIADLYYFYVVLGEYDPSVVEKFMGFPYETAQHFYHYFLQYYLETKEEEKLREVTEKASLLCYVRMIRKLHKKGEVPEEDKEKIAHYLKKIEELVDRLDSLAYS